MACIKENYRNNIDGKCICMCLYVCTNRKVCINSVWLNEPPWHLWLNDNRNNGIPFLFGSGTPGVTSSVTKQVFMSWILNLVYWEKTNCARTEIELRSLNVLLERCPQCTTHLAAPHWFYFLIVLMHVVTKVHTPSKNVTFGTPPRVLKSIQPRHLRFSGTLCVILHLYL